MVEGIHLIMNLRFMFMIMIKLMSKCSEHQPVESCGDGTVHEVGNPASPAIPLTRVELGAVSWVRHQVFLWVPCYARANFVVN